MYFKKKPKGLKRKIHTMTNNLIVQTEIFPEIDLDSGYWHLHIPIKNSLIDSTNTPIKVKRLCIQMLIDRAYHLMQIKPKISESLRIVVAISLPLISDSQIIIFFGDEYYLNFFDRNSPEQKWIELESHRSIISEWNIHLPKEFSSKGFKEEINDEDYHFIGEEWFCGEI